MEIAKFNFLYLLPIFHIYFCHWHTGIKIYFFIIYFLGSAFCLTCRSVNICSSACNVQQLQWRSECIFAYTSQNIVFVRSGALGFLWWSDGDWPRDYRGGFSVANRGVRWWVMAMGGDVEEVLLDKEECDCDKEEYDLEKGEFREIDIGRGGGFHGLIHERRIRIETATQRKKKTILLRWVCLF